MKQQKALPTDTTRPSEAPHHQLDFIDDTGAQTAEYGIVMLAAAGFAALLAMVLSSGGVQSLIQGLVERALNFN